MVRVMPWKENIQINGKVIAKVRELSRNVVCNCQFRPDLHG